MIAAGAPSDVIERQRQKHQSGTTIEILKSNYAALMWFFQVYDLLRWNQHYCLGLDVVAVEADARMRGVEVNKNDYQRLRTLVDYYSQAINEDKE